MNIAQHFAQQERLLQMEYDYEKEEYQKLCQQVGIQRRIRQGKCWYPIAVGRTFYNALDQFCIEVTCPDSILQREVKDPTTGELANKDIEFEFEPGRPVSFFRVASKDDKEKTIFFPYQCQVSRYDGQRLQINMVGGKHLRERGQRTGAVFQKYGKLIDDHGLSSP